MTKDVLSNKIKKYQEKIVDEQRDYIGASGIGSDCVRQIWYQYKGTEAEDVPAKVRRTWAIGKELEGLVLQWLEDIGIQISTTLWDLQSKKVPEFKGHVDAIWLKKEEPYAIIEVKTAKDSSFKIFVNKGVKVWNKQYYAQLQAYMGMSGIRNAYIIVLNKDNSDISDELVVFDEEYYSALEDKALMIVNAVVEPPRINNSPLWYFCKMCKFNKVCHK